MSIKEQMHTCIKDYKGLFTEGKSYRRIDDGEDIYMIPMTTGGQIYVPMCDYENHFLFDSDAECDRIRPYTCRCGHKAMVCNSSAGYYIGTVDEDGLPNCRTTDYYNSKAFAQSDLEHGTYKERNNTENAFVCGIGACMIKQR